MEYILEMIDVALALNNMQELDMINTFIDRMIRKLEKGLRMPPEGAWPASLATSEVRWAAEAPY